MTVTLVQLLGRLADDAMLHRRPAPVITTDMFSALIVAKALRETLPGYEPCPQGVPSRECIAMFDGVIIKVGP